MESFAYIGLKYVNKYMVFAYYVQSIITYSVTIEKRIRAQLEKSKLHWESMKESEEYFDFE